MQPPRVQGLLLLHAAKLQVPYVDCQEPAPHWSWGHHSCTFMYAGLTLHSRVTPATFFRSFRKKGLKGWVTKFCLSILLTLQPVLVQVWQDNSRLLVKDLAGYHGMAPKEVVAALDQYKQAHPKHAPHMYRWMCGDSFWQLVRHLAIMLATVSHCSSACWGLMLTFL